MKNPDAVRLFRVFHTTNRVYYNNYNHIKDNSLSLDRFADSQ